MKGTSSPILLAGMKKGLRCRESLWVCPGCSGLAVHQEVLAGLSQGELGIHAGLVYEVHKTVQATDAVVTDDGSRATICNRQVLRVEDHGRLDVGDRRRYSDDRELARREQRASEQRVRRVG